MAHSRFDIDFRNQNNKKISAKGEKDSKEALNL